MKLILTALIMMMATASQAAETEACVFSSREKNVALVVRKEGRTDSGGGAIESVPVLQTKDVKRFVAKRRSEISRLYIDTKALEVLTAMDIDVPWKQTQSITVTALNNNKNREAFEGAMIVTLLDAQKNVLLRVGQLGLNAGICQ